MQACLQYTACGINSPDKPKETDGPTDGRTDGRGHFYDVKKYLRYIHRLPTYLPL